MDKKTAAAFLKKHAPGWKEADNAAHFVKAATDPKVRAQCLQALTLCTTDSKPTKAKAPKATATESTTTTEG